jgi:hypothetical protein
MIVSTPARVTLTRTAEADVRQRQVIVSIDDGAKKNLMFGESVTLDVPAGAHRLRAYNTLVWKNVDFSVEPGEAVTFQIINRASRFALGFLSLVGVAPLYLTIEKS